MRNDDEISDFGIILRQISSETLKETRVREMTRRKHPQMIFIVVLTCFPVEISRYA